MREHRYLASRADAARLAELLTAAPLRYRVTNIYLDDAQRRFSRTDAGAPRFRVRLYEADGLHFGAIERKSVEAREERRKRTWDLAPRVGELPVSLPSPLGSSPYPELVRAFDEEPLDVRGTTYLASLAYDRLSYRTESGRISIDSAFEPRLAGVEVIVEVKGTPPPEVERLALRPLAESKFALLMRRALPIAVSAEDCASEPVAGALGALSAKLDERLEIAIPPIGARVTVATDHPITADLLRRLWDARDAPDIDSVDVAIRDDAAARGRVVDPVAGTQLLSWPYAPFTIVKQALRWQHAVVCTETTRMPLHGCVIDSGGRRVCITGVGGAGKSHLTRAWLERDADAAVLVEDWSLVDSVTRRLYPISESLLHAKGSAAHDGLLLAARDDGELVELCDASSDSPDSRYVIDRRHLPRFRDCKPGETLDAIVILEGAFGAPYRLAREARPALDRDGGVFWDKSNRSLPPRTVESMRAKWESLFGAIPVFAASGYAHEGVSRLIDDLTS